MTPKNKPAKKRYSLLLIAALFCSLLVITYISTTASSYGLLWWEKQTAKWTTKADFESNASTVKKPTTISNIEVSGINASDDSSLSLKKETATSYYKSGTVSGFKIYSGSPYYQGDWVTIKWNNITPPGMWSPWSGVYFRFRTSSSEKKLSMATWSSFVDTRNYSETSVLAEESRWLEVEVKLESTTDGSGTPILNNFSIEYYKKPVPYYPHINLSVRPKNRVVRAGQTVVLRGQLLNSLDEPLANKKIDIFRRIVGENMWATARYLTTVRTNAQGIFVKKLRVYKTSKYVVRFSGSGYWKQTRPPRILITVKKPKRK